MGLSNKRALITLLSSSILGERKRTDDLSNQLKQEFLVILLYITNGRERFQHIRLYSKYQKKMPFAL